MASLPPIQVYERPSSIAINSDFSIKVQPAADHPEQLWQDIAVYAVEVANVDTSSNSFQRHTVGVASFDMSVPVRVQVSYTASTVHSAVMRPRSFNIQPRVENATTIIFRLDQPRDVMLELNGSKWQALHLLTNKIDTDAPSSDTDDIWYFGPGLNNGSAYSKLTDGVNLLVPGGKTIYLAGGAFIDFRINFIGVSHAAIRGHGFILGPVGGYVHREHGGAIHMSGADHILVEGVTSLGANGFSLSAGECSHVRVAGYRCFSSAGNGDGIDFFCSSDVVIENCFLRTSDDCIALYSHRWDWYGDSENITIQDCVLLPDIAHAINMGTHGCPSRPETTRNVLVRNVDILDHEEHQLWYQGCIAINVADENLFHDILVEDVRVERITHGQLLNIRIMQNAMWTTAPGRAIRNLVFRDVCLDMQESKIVNPSVILGYDRTRGVENVTFEDLRIGNTVIHDEMDKPRWYMVSDFVPLFVNEHVRGLRFIRSN
ncbi:putative endo-polygalacturonase [Aspergillus homomorphus CBS 101889]|uniref:Pectin lyase-like protein n=1 Tax=Aspergillus homomorphus (strain CBS 101889) TaxID=1450537 RepID=A0A395HNK4_ASPHC|nr:pectin lyase-like protein [Aspergillus homomorphus CBS 101889]RAL08855.1 pectin lyase-like protein [Aspergillus homomorphus CBS 101889]